MHNQVRLMVQGDSEPYSAIPKDIGRIFMNICRSSRTVNTAGYITFLGGPAFGTDALIGIVQAFNWSKVAIYYQNNPNDAYLAHTFSESLARLRLQIALRLTESGGDDLTPLLAASTNIFVFFGGDGCFNVVARAIIEQRPEVAVLCCCKQSIPRSCVSLPSMQRDLSPESFLSRRRE